MGQPMKKGKAGNAVNYLTRSQALRKLQVSLADFRRLCILKGIYPRDPKKKVKGTDKTYYHVKDVKYLMHEPLLAKFRELKAFMNKVKKAAGKGQKSTAQRLDKNKPTYTLDHLLKERYPTFVSALGDLDDALCTLEIFAALPATDNRQIPASVIRESSELINEFRAICVKQRALKKAFVSIKGYYYQVEFLGQQITWLAPHKFSQHLPAEVDFRVLMTFLEFYRTLLKFVNFKLERLQEQGYIPEVSETQGVFRKRSIFVSREVPRHALEFVLAASGAKVIYPGCPSGETENDESITHQIVDRPINMLGETISNGNGRDFIQPQWVFDSLNAGKLLPCVPYGPGRVCPPHLSPFIDDVREGYTPADRRQKSNDDSTAAPNGQQDLNDSELSFDEIEEAERRELGIEKPKVQPSDSAAAVEGSATTSKAASTTKKRTVTEKREEEDDESSDEEDESIEGDFDGVEGSDDDDDDDEIIEDSEDEGEEEESDEESDEEVKESSKKLSIAEKKKADELARRRTLLSSNQRKLYDAMKATNATQSDRNKQLEAKRAAIEKSQKKASAAEKPAKKAKKL